MNDLFMWYKNVGTIFFRFVTMHVFDRKTDRKALAIQCVALHATCTVKICQQIYEQTVITGRQPPVLKLLSRRFWGLSPCRSNKIHGLAWNLAQRFPPPCQISHCEADIWVFLAQKNHKLAKLPFFDPQGRTPCPMLVKSVEFMR